MKRSSIHMVLGNIPKLVPIVLMWVLTVRGVLFRVKLKTAGCSQNCSLPSATNYNKNKCASSILINGKEYSHQKDGFNIAIIDNKLGNVSAYHINSFPKRSRTTEEEERKNFFDNLPDNFTITLVSQNICAHFDKQLYTYLQKASIRIAHSPKSTFNQDIAVVVGCKGSCPDWSSVKIPFSYFGTGKAFKKTFIIKIDGSNKSIEQGKEPNTPEQYAAEMDPNTNGRDRGHMGTILGGIIAVVFAICIIAVIYVTNKRPSNNGTLLCCHIEEGTLTPENLRKVQDGKSGNTKGMHLLRGEKNGQMIGSTNDHHKQKLLSNEPLQSPLGEPDFLPTLTDTYAPSAFCIERAYFSPDKSSHEICPPDQGSPLLYKAIGKEVSNNEHQHDQRQTSSNITSVSSLVDNDCHRSDPALLQPGTSVLTSDSFLNEKRPSRSNSSRRHYRRHSRRSVQRHSSGIGRSESTPDVVSENQCCNQVFELNLKPLQQKTIVESFKS